VEEWSEHARENMEMRCKGCLINMQDIQRTIYLFSSRNYDLIFCTKETLDRGIGERDRERERAHERLPAMPVEFKMLGQ